MRLMLTPMILSSMTLLMPKIGGAPVAKFIGRDEQLRALNRQFELVRAAGADHPGRALLVRGRRRVGKSRLIEEFIERTGVPHVYFTASMQKLAEELRL